MKQQRKIITKINWSGITWLMLILLSLIFFLIAIGFVAFPPKYILPLGLILLAIDALMCYFSLSRKKRKTKKEKSKYKIIVTIVNCFLSFALMIGSIYLPILQSQMKGLFVEPTDKQEVKINAYVMTSAYKNAHTDIFSETSTSTNLEDYKDKKFITQSTVDKDNQAYAVEDIKKQLNVGSLNTIAEKSNINAASALYNGIGDVMLLNANYENSFADVSGYENFTTDTQILYTTVITVKVEQKEVAAQDYTNTSFSVFIAGSDSRDTQLTYYTRTDVDMILTVDPVNKQILLVSMPRDWYVKNPALGNGYDKLTHLGNDGLQNSIDGLNQEFDFDYINNYFEVNFVTFKNIVDAIDGIDVNNPYEFVTDDNNYFAAGQIHLSGDEALAYVRERHHLSNGDYGRNEHQAIVLQAIISKVSSKEVISNFGNLLNNLQGNFLTSLSSDDIYSLAKMQLNDGGKWNFVSYHLGGQGDYNSTASMGDQQLYVSYPFESQIKFAKEQISMVMNGQIITQGALSEEDQTVFLPN
jgi:LCP family protein required for cell wall assembly